MRTEDILPGMFNILEAVIAQHRYCQDHEVGILSPTGGSCWRCNNNIYFPIQYGEYDEYTSGITIERAGNELITRCPHCNYPFNKEKP